MPMYDYICNSCGYKFDKLVSFTASDKDIECPQCCKKNSKNSYVLQIFLMELATRKVKTPAIHPLDFLEHNF